MEIKKPEIENHNPTEGLVIDNFINQPVFDDFKEKMRLLFNDPDQEELVQSTTAKIILSCSKPGEFRERSVNDFVVKDRYKKDIPKEFQSILNLKDYFNLLNKTFEKFLETPHLITYIQEKFKLPDRIFNNNGNYTEYGIKNRVPTYEKWVKSYGNFSKLNGLTDEIRKQFNLE